MKTQKPSRRDFLGLAGKIMALSGAAAAGLPLAACHRDRDAKTGHLVSSGDDPYVGAELETWGQGLNGQITVGRAPFARVWRWVDVVQPDTVNYPDQYDLTFNEKYGGSQIVTTSASTKLPDGSYICALNNAGELNRIRFFPGATPMINTDFNGDWLFEDKDTLEHLVSRNEDQPVRLGQNALINFAISGQPVLSAAMRWTDFDPTSVTFQKQDGTIYQSALYQRLDGALGGTVVVDGHSFEFALYKDGRMRMSRYNGAPVDVPAGRFVSQGLPERKFGTALMGKTGKVSNIVLGSKGYDIATTGINDGNSTVDMVVNGEVIPALKT